MRVVVVLAGLLIFAHPGWTQVRFDERVDVARVLVDARVVDSRGRPCRGLDAADFRVEIDGRPARLQSATWIGLPAPAGGDGSDEPTAAPQPRVGPAGRRIVFFVQWSLEPSRITGMLQMLRESARFVERLQPDDRAAIMVFDYHLRVRQDFTGDRARLRAALYGGILSDAPRTTPTDGVSIRAHLDPGKAARAATPEKALAVLADALRPVEGAKDLVLLGHGFGQYRPVIGSLVGTATLDRDYDAAREALVRARVTVFALDVTDADQHTLETALMTAADDTGGFYQKAHQFQDLAMDRLEGALQGYYMLAVERPARRRGRHTISVHVNRKGTDVRARRYYVD